MNAKKNGVRLTDVLAVLASLAFLAVFAVPALVKYCRSENPDVVQEEEPAQSQEQLDKCGEWQDFCLELKGNKICLSLDFNSGRVTALVPCTALQASRCTNLCDVSAGCKMDSLNEWWKADCGDLPKKPPWWSCPNNTTTTELEPPFG